MISDTDQWRGGARWRGEFLGDGGAAYWQNSKCADRRRKQKN